MIPPKKKRSKVIKDDDDEEAEWDQDDLEDSGGDDGSAYEVQNHLYFHRISSYFEGTRLMYIHVSVGSHSYHTAVIP